MRKALLILLMIVICIGARSQVTVEINALEGKLVSAKNDFLMGKLDDAITSLAFIVEQLEITKVQRPLIEREANLYVEALNYLAQCYLNKGKEHEAQYYFATLIQFQPDYELDSVLTPVNVLNFYNNLKRSLVGYLSLIVNPSDAVIYIDQKPISAGGLEKYPLMAGSHTVLVERPGYSSETKEIIIYAGKVSQMGVMNLRRSGSVCFVSTYPVEVEVILDGVTIGITEKGAPADLADYAKRNKLELNNFSAYFPIEINDPLDHVVEFRKPCYQKEQIIIKYTEFKDYYYEPIVLKASYAQLELEAEADGKVYIDGGLVGDLKQHNFQICAGMHKLMIKTAWGNYSQDINIKEGDTQKIKIDIKPSLLYMGIIGEEGTSDFIKKHSEELAKNRLNQLKNIVVMDKSKDKIITKAGELSVADIAKNMLKEFKDGNLDMLRSQIEILRDNTDAHLFLFGVIAVDKVKKAVDFYLFSDLTPSPDINTLDIEGEVSWNQYFYLLENEMPLNDKVLPLTFVDSGLYDNPIIIEAMGNQISSIQAGDLIMAVDRKPVKLAIEVKNKLQEIKTDKINLEIYSRKNKAIQAVDVPVKHIPYEIAFSNYKMLYNKQLINLLKYISVEDENVKNLALYNVGLFFYRMQEYEKALQYLKQVQEIKKINLLKQRIQYRIGQCYYELGLKKEAREIFEQLKKDDFTTLEDKVSPSLSILADAYLKLLE
jgi:tetratricopeptide (TPR) repeat protein